MPLRINDDKFMPPLWMSRRVAFIGKVIEHACDKEHIGFVPQRTYPLVLANQKLVVTIGGECNTVFNTPGTQAQRLQALKEMIIKHLPKNVLLTYFQDAQKADNNLLMMEFKDNKPFRRLTALVKRIKHNIRLKFQPKPKKVKSTKG